MSQKPGMITVVEGLQFGDEGKGKIVDMLGQNVDIAVRYNGGANAGHSIEVNGQIVVLNTMPSSAFSDTICLIGQGVVINPILLKEEIEKVALYGGNPSKNLRISLGAHLILPTHLLLDDAEETYKGTKKVGSTKNGIGPAYQDRVGRFGIPIGRIFKDTFEDEFWELTNMHMDKLTTYKYEPKDGETLQSTIQNLSKKWFEAIDFLREFQFISCSYFLNDALNEGKHVLAEGAQATMLDLAFGTYPYVTSSRPIASAAASELGVAASYIQSVKGIFKIYATRVGGGPFPTKIEGDLAEVLQTAGHEFGSRTGRRRDVGWLDLPALKYALMVNGATSVIITKTDIFDILRERDETIRVCTHYEIDGVRTDRIPESYDGHTIVPIYKEFSPWKEGTVAGSKSFAELPKEAQELFSFIQDAINVPIEGISVGPGREDYFSL